MPCLVAAPTVVPYHAGQEEYFNGLLTEENTKIALINPTLCALGWQVDKPEEVSMEFRLNRADDPVDYALLVAGKPALLVEAKALGQNLLDHKAEKWANQIMGYAGTDGVTWVVLTDGDEYRIYNATVPVPFDQKLFRSVRISDPATRPEETLLLLSKDKINDINEQWQEHFADSRVRAAVKTLFSPPPNPLLTSFVKKQVQGTGLTLGQIKASLARMVASFELPVDPAAVEPMKAMPNGGGGVRVPSVPGKVGDEKLSDAAAEVLVKSKEPMTAQQMIDKMAADGLWSSPASKRPATTLTARIGEEIKDKGEESRFIRVGRGLYSYNAGGR
jgi:hypothetical protein